MPNLAEEAARKAKYYVANKAKILARNAAWARANPDKVAARKLRYNSQHRQEQSEHTGRYIREHPETNRANQRKRRAQKYGAAGTHTKEEFDELCKRYGNRCLGPGPHCGGDLTEDHVEPLSKGGSDSIDNIQPLCKRCNDSKGVKTVDYRSMAQ